MKSTRRAIASTAGVLVALVALAACGSSPAADKAGTDTKNTTQATGSAPQLEKVAPIEVKPCTGTPKLAFVGGKTGVLASVGSEAANGAKLAVDAFNAANPTAKVSYVEFDTKSGVGSIGTLVRPLAADGCVVGVVGPISSAETFPVANIIDTVDLSLITPSATNPDLSTQKWDTFHRALGNDKVQAAAIAKYLTSTLKSKNSVVVSDGTAYGKQLAYGVELALGDQMAGTVTFEQVSLIGPKLMESIKRANPSAVFFSGDSANAALLLKALRTAKIDAPFVGADSLLDGRFAPDAGAAAENATAICLCAEAGRIPAASKFVEDYTAAFSKKPGHFAIEAFDAANFFLEAIKAGNTDRASVNKYIGSTPYKGLTKVLEFDAKGEIKGANAYAYVFGKGDDVKGVLIG